MSKNIPNASEMGKKGGRKRFEQIGSEGMAAIGAKGRETIKKRDPDFYKRIQKLSAAKRKANSLARKNMSPADKLVNLINGK